MAPARKRVRTTHNAEERHFSGLLSDYRAAWLVKDDSRTIEIRAKGETFMVHRRVLETQSEYFAACLKKNYMESNGEIDFDDIEPGYLAYFIGVAYSYSSIVPVTPPVPTPNPEGSAPGMALKILVEVYKLCDRFVCPRMSAYMVNYIRNSIGDNHRALFRSVHDQGLQLALTRDFADGYEALELAHTLQGELAGEMIKYFCEGVSYGTWEKWVEENVGKSQSFMGAVSVYWAKKLEDCMARKGKRKELKGP